MGNDSADVGAPVDELRFSVEFHLNLNAYRYEAAKFETLNIFAGGCSAGGAGVGAHCLFELVEASGVVGADECGGEILISRDLVSVEEDAIVLLRSEIEDGEIAGALIVGLG